jgi:hypothetical protein
MPLKCFQLLAPLFAPEELAPAVNILQQKPKALLEVLEQTSHHLFSFRPLSKILSANVAEKYLFLPYKGVVGRDRAPGFFSTPKQMLDGSLNSAKFLTFLP